MLSHNTKLICSGVVRDMTSGMRVFWKKDSASIQSFADVRRNREAFIAGDG